jgi:hypothetical protein
MSVIELRDLTQARRFLVQGLWLQRALPPTEATVRPALEWALEVAADGHPLPPPGFVADLGNTAFGLDRGARTGREALAVPGLPAALARTYEDEVLGRVYADWSFERASDALRRYREGRDRARGLAFLLNQFRERAGFGGVHLSPAVIKSLAKDAPDRVLAEGWDSLTRDGLLPLLTDLYESLIAAARQRPEVLGPEDVFELEHGTALAELGQRVALRQVLQAARRLEEALPPHKVRPRAGRQEVPTRILDEDTYPVGGFASLSNRGSVESLLHSQLAFMEQDDRPDLFDVKFLRDELLYYARDDNQFLRRRRTFVFALFPDLVQARFKDAELPWQRGVLLLALLVVAVRKLSEWLSTDALLFEFLFMDGKEGKEAEEKDAGLLAPERNLLATILREQVANGTVALARVPSADQVARRCALRARRSLCHCLASAAADQPLQAEATVVTRLRLDGSCPAVGVSADPLAVPEAEDPLGSWAATLEGLLQGWV